MAKTILNSLCYRESNDWLACLCLSQPGIILHRNFRPEDPRYGQRMWAERERQKCRFSLRLISVTFAHRSVPAPRPPALRSAHAPVDFFIPAYRSAPVHRIFFSLLRSPSHSVNFNHNHALVTLNCYNLFPRILTLLLGTSNYTTLALLAFVMLWLIETKIFFHQKCGTANG